MTKYNEEFKLMVVQEYLSGSLGYRAIAKKYGIGDSPLRRWVRAFKEFGHSGLSVKKTEQFYSVQFKLDVLNFMKRTGASVAIARKAYNIIITHCGQQFFGAFHETLAKQSCTVVTYQRKE